MSVSAISGQDTPVDWNDNKRTVTVNKSMDENKYITNNEYYDVCGMTENKRFELQRRHTNTLYTESITSLSNHDSKNNFNTGYTQEKIQWWNIQRKELFMKYRLKRKFKTFSSTQSGLAKCCKNITQDFKKQCNSESRKPILFFGNGSFSPGGSGYASVPRKPVIRNLAAQFPIFITDEYNTSKKCPIKFEDVEDTSTKNKTKSSGQATQYVCNYKRRHRCIK